MIISIWKPKYKQKIIIYYYKENINVLKNKPKGLKIIYKCDKCNSISSTTSHTLFNNNYKFINVNKQLCRKCRGIYSEYITKDSIVKYDSFKFLLEKEGYTVITTKKDFELHSHPSSVLVNVVCPKGHDHNVTWNNFKTNKRRCRKCYESIKSISSQENFKLYKHVVKKYTEKNYNKNYNKINPLNLKRCRKYHLDHKYSIVEGYKNNIPPYIIGNYINLQIITGTNNNKKYTSCSISKEYLLNEYIKENKHNK